MKDKDYGFGYIRNLFIQAYRANLGEIPMNILNTMDILFENKKHKPLIIKPKDKNQKGISKNKNGWHFVFTMNPGCDYDYVYKHRSMFQSCVSGIVDI